MTTTTPNATYPLLGELASTLALGRAVEERMRKECACALAVPQVWADLNAAALAIDAEMAKESNAQGEPESGLRDAYEGAREDLLDWKGRAQRAEARLRNLGWAGVDASEPQTGEHEQRSCEGLDDGEAQRASAWLAVVSVLNEVAPTWHRDSIGTGREQVCAAIRALAQRASERRPIADEVVAYCDPSDPVNRTAFAWPGTDREERHSCALYTHPRGLPAGSDAKLADTQRAIIEAAEQRGYDRAVSERPIATVEQPSCGQDARDAAACWEWVRQRISIGGRFEGYSIGVPLGSSGLVPAKTAKANDRRARAAIAAQQRQGGAP